MPERLPLYKEIVMCLSKIKEIPEKYLDSKVEHVGWKVIFVQENHWSSEFKPYTGKHEYDVWITDDKIDPIKTTEVSYPTGFHIFTDLNSAKVWCKFNVYTEVREVRFRDVVAFGDQDRFSDVVVAREIFVEGEVKEDDNEDDND